MKRLNVHVLYEYGIDMRPHGSAYLRLLRPLSYPAVQKQINASFGRDLNQSQPDLVLLDRLWCPDISPQKVQELAKEVHRQGGKLIHWFDDNFLEVRFGDKRSREIRRESFQACLEVSDALVVTTQVLAETFRQYGRPIQVIQNHLDERLIVRKPPSTTNTASKIVIGYMGTATHDDDLRLLLPAFQELNQKYPGKLHFQFIGILDDRKLRHFEEIKELSFEIIRPLPAEIEYPLFMVWFTSSVWWDLAVAPLQDNLFTRCKSDVKHLDYAAAGIPAIFSNVPAYSSVKHQKTGLVVNNSSDDWADALDQMIQSVSLRAELAQNASNYLFGDRILRKRYEEWVDVLISFAQGL